MTTTVEPERELVRRLLPYSLPVLAVASVAGGLLGNAGAAWSAAIGVASVVVNFVGYAYSVAWAARISPMLLMGVGLGGFVVRLATLTVALLLLDRLNWFSPVAFAAAFVPTTIVLLVVEMRLLAGRMQVDLWSIGRGAAR
jgi:ATP synthase I subunit